MTEKANHLEQELQRRGKWVGALIVEKIWKQSLSARFWKHSLSAADKLWV